MSSMIRFSPSTQLRGLQREVDHLFENFFNDGFNADTPSMWTPRADVAETDENYTVHVDVPGMNKEDLDINFQDGMLTISGERKSEVKEEKENFVRMERSTGRFYRSFRLPKQIDADRIGATYTDGVLTLTVPKAEETKPRRIEVS